MQGICGHGSTGLAEVGFKSDARGSPEGKVAGYWPGLEKVHDTLWEPI